MAPARKARAEAAEAADGEISFEVALERLEAVVKSLEGGELKLETALEQFEQGVRLMRRCGDQLDRAERRIGELVEEAGGLAERGFELGVEGVSVDADEEEA
jgi:exodeoxyribonuclease VII small subunit